MVKMSKKVDGAFYVVEAVPDTKAKKLAIVSAYIEKPSQQTSDVQAPLSNVQNDSVDNGYTDSITEISEKSKRGFSDEISEGKKQYSFKKSTAGENAESSYYDETGLADDAAENPRSDQFDGLFADYAQREEAIAEQKDEREQKEKT